MPESLSGPPTCSSTSPAGSGSTSPAPTSPSPWRSPQQPRAFASARALRPSAKSGSPGDCGPPPRPSGGSRSAPSWASPGSSFRRALPPMAHFEWSRPKRSGERSEWGSVAQTKGSRPRRDGRAVDLGFTRTPSEDDPRRNAQLLNAIARVAPGTDLRSGIDDVIRAKEGALVVVGDPEALSFLYSGGIRLDQPFTPQLLYELAKMDGAIIVTEDLQRLAYANVQLMPDPDIPSDETGTRHRTAERVAKQTGTMVVSVSQQRMTVTLFVGDSRYPLEPIADVLAKTNQALATLDTYAQRFRQVLTRLTALEFQNAVVLDDVLIVLQRAEMTTRMAEEIERDCVELGTEGRLMRMQLEELVADLPVEKASVVLDYQERGGDREAQQVILGLASLPY